MFEKILIENFHKITKKNIRENTENMYTELIL